MIGDARLTAVGFLFCGGLLLTLGDIVMKKWALGHGTIWGAAGLFVWFLGLLCLAATMKQTNIAIASVILVYFNVTSLAVAEYVLFGTPLTLPKMAGGALGLISIALMEF